MANLAVYIETGDGGKPTQASIRALAQARRVSEALGASVYALVPSATEAADVEGLSVRLGACGADRVLICSPGLPGAVPLYDAAGPLLEALVKMLRPRLFVFPIGDAAVQLAPMLAARVLAEFLPNACVDTAATQPPDGEASALWLRRLHADGRWQQSLDVLAADRMVVCSLVGDLSQQAPGGSDVEVDTFSSPPSRPTAVQTRSQPRGFDVTDLECLIIDDVTDVTEAAEAVITSAEALRLWGLLCPSRLVLMGSQLSEMAWVLLPLNGRVGVCQRSGNKPRTPPGAHVVWKTNAPDASAQLWQARPVRMGFKAS